MIEVENLTKRYGDVVAVNGISFTARPGQVTGFLGPNGAGKTTTMRMLTGYIPPTSGKAIVAGYDVFDQSLEVRKRVGYLPENVPLYRDMTARGYLMYVGEIRGLRGTRRRADEVLERVGLLSRANSQIRTLSKGMKQRVGLASALLHDPDVLILDEPTIGLDPIQVLELRALVRELGRDHTLLFSTHILSEAEQVCDNVVIINQGRIIAQGAPGELRGQLERGGRVLVRTDAQPIAVLDAVRGLSSVGAAEIALDGVVVTPSAAQSDPRPEIAATVVNRGWKLMELRPLAVNLEEIFLELTQHESRAQAAQAQTLAEAEAEETAGV
ncbi:ABC transporter ATP-binding protein [Anaerolineae bacterium CFX9]|jgi:ABC-2 type transport system ATP-binding protein|nr:ABC transporter ATP-binding protein [Anaerolineae bacterium CFX9]